MMAGAPERAGFLATMRAVLWSFVGVRKRRDYQDDARSLDPRAVIVAGILGGLIFVLSLVMVVSWVVPG
ncbi:MAG: DUF2970 domain-containing protein [Rhodocyclaceae bacterium]|nr:DUF2970 domain-containing protein [Rhodocyclaceae bacterium]